MHFIPQKKSKVQPSPNTKPDRGRRDLNRAQRRRLDRAVQGLMGKDGCSICGAAFDHNACTYGGCDRYGRPAVVGDCCREHLVQVTAMGFYTTRIYDFLEHTGKREPRRSTPNSTAEITSAIAAYRGWIEKTDRQADGMERRAGVRGLGPVSVLETPWKTDDRLWFEQNPDRSHRARPVFPGEADEQAAKTPPGTVLLTLVRQVEPGKRVRASFYLNAALWPVPDDDAIAHALFDIATRQQAQPQNAAERAALVEKYHAAGRGH
jgi:hypothetical protein